MGALFNVKINLASIKDESYVSELEKRVEKLESDAIFCEKSILCFPNCQTQYIIDNIHSLSGEIHGIFFTEDKADNIHCENFRNRQNRKTGRYRSNDDRY